MFSSYGNVDDSSDGVQRVEKEFIGWSKKWAVWIGGSIKVKWLSSRTPWKSSIDAISKVLSWPRESPVSSLVSFIDKLEVNYSGLGEEASALVDDFTEIDALHRMS